MSQENNTKKETKNSTWNIKPYLAMGLTALMVMMIAVVFFFFVYRYKGATQWIQLAVNALQPITFGIIIAYLLNPMMNQIQRNLEKNTKLAKKPVKVLSVAGALLFGLVVLGAFGWIVVPKVYASIEELIIGMPQMIEETAVGLQGFWAEHKTLATYFGGAFNEAASYLEELLRTELIPQASVLISQITTGIFSMAKGLLNFVIGIIVSVYVLMEKEHFLAIGKKVVFGICSRKVGNLTVTTMKKAHEVFSGFIIGKIIDSAIIGVLTFVVLTIVRMPSALLVSVIVGVTNVIPFFGPFIGAIPSFFLILIQNPIKSLWFLLIILIIQQIDGNIIGPKILGDTTGLSSFWVITSILLSGGLFGFAGMVLGVPVFAMLYYCAGEVTKYLLRKKGLPEETEAYMTVKERDAETGQLIYHSAEDAEVTEEEE